LTSTPAAAFFFAHAANPGGIEKGASMDKTVAAAQAIATARFARTALPSLAADIAPQSLAEGYDVQEALRGLLQPRLGAWAGYKIGCTSAVMQQYLSIPHPCAGSIFASRVHDSGVTLRTDDYVRVGVECEIAVRLGRDLPADGEPLTDGGLAQAIDCYFPAVEIVDDRYAKWETMGAPTLVADDFFAAGCVLGRPVPRSVIADLRDVRGSARINGHEVAYGTGADVLGHPHLALQWLVQHLATRGQGLRAGQIVMTGSLVKTLWLGAGDSVKMVFSGLGEVELAFV